MDNIYIPSDALTSLLKQPTNSLTYSWLMTSLEISDM